MVAEPCNDRVCVTVAVLDRVQPFVQIVDIIPPVTVGKDHRGNGAFNLKTLDRSPAVLCRLLESQHALARVAVLCFVVSSMLAMGAGLTLAQILEPLRDARLVALSLVANFVLMPLCAFVLAKALSLDEPLGVGLLLLGCAAGAPFLPKLAELAKGNLAFAVGVMVLLMVVTVGYLPIVLPLLLPGVSVDPWKIARSLVLLMLLPLAAGLVLRARYENLAARVKPLLDRISNISLILLVLLITAANLDKVLQVFGTRGILAGFLFIALGFGVGWLLGGPGADTRRVMALGTAQRNIAAALVVASQSFNDPKVVVMVVVVAIAGLIVLMPSSRALANQRFTAQ
jgi:bile acid:Na+ symporter, BASS family